MITIRSLNTIPFLFSVTASASCADTHTGITSIIDISEPISMSELFPGYYKICVVPEYNHVSKFADENGIDVNLDIFVRELEVLVLLIEKSGDASYELVRNDANGNRMIFQNHGCFSISGGAIISQQAKSPFGGTFYKIKIMTGE